MITRYSTPAVTPRHLIIRGLVRRVGRLAESTGTILILLIFSGAVLRLLLHTVESRPDLSPPTPLERISYWFAYLFTLWQAALHRRELLRRAIRNPFAPGVVLIAVLSVLWSDDPVVSFRNAFGLSMATLFGLYLGSRYSAEEVLQHLGAALGIAGVLSLVFGLVAPEYGVTQGVDGGSWRGVFVHKNLLGQTMLLACAVFWLLRRARQGHRLPKAAGVVLAVVLVYLSRSLTALVIGGALLFIMPAVIALRRGGAAAAVVLCGLLAIGAATSVAIAERELVLSAVGREVTLTGRTTLWAAVGERITERPLLGYGYGAFWEGGSRSSEAVRAAIGWDTPNSHNGFLDLWLDLGLVGLLTFLGGLMVAARRAWLAFRATAGLDSLWAITFLIVLTLSNVTETAIYQSYLAWVIYLAVAGIAYRPPRGRADAVGLAHPQVGRSRVVRQ